MPNAIARRGKKEVARVRSVPLPVYYSEPDVSVILVTLMDILVVSQPAGGQVFCLAGDLEPVVRHLRLREWEMVNEGGGNNGGANPNLSQWPNFNFTKSPRRTTYQILYRKIITPKSTNMTNKASY